MKLPRILHRSSKGKVWKIVVLFLALALLAFVVISISRLGELNDLGIGKLTGFPGFRSYLVVFQNDAERRPTGGFITAYGVLKIRLGIPSLSFGNVYDEKLIQKGTVPPDPTVAELIGGPLYPGHGFRDGNIDPDFSVSAKELMRLYQLGYPKQKFDGVIAVDFTAFENLVNALQPELAGEAGLFSKIEDSVQEVDIHDPAALKNRKNFLGDLAKQLIKTVIFSPSLQDDAAGSLVQSLYEKHILLYFQDSELQKRAEEKGWTGKLPFSASSDLLAINEGNYGGMKSSRYLVRDVNYDVEFQETDKGLEPVASLKVRVAHRGDVAEPISGYYKGYWRIYAPLGAELLSGRVENVAGDAYRQVWSKVVEMNPGEEREISLSYKLPEFVAKDGVYSLGLVKQPGSSADHYRVTIKLPAGFRFQVSGVRGQGSEGFDVRENLAIFETELNSDTDLSLKIIPDLAPPRLSWQEFIGGINTINLRFNEALDSESLKQAVFTIKDLNYRNKTTDPVSIQNVRFVFPQDVYLDLAGVSEECREWYEVGLSGVADKRGNILKDKKITVVQWLNTEGENCDPERKL